MMSFFDLADLQCFQLVSRDCNIVFCSEVHVFEATKNVAPASDSYSSLVAGGVESKCSPLELLSS